MSEKSWWYIALAISVFSIAIIFFYWNREVATHQQYTDRVSTQSEVSNYLANNVDVENAPETPIYVPTGIFIQSLEFVNASDVNVTGYLWQEYDASVPEDISRGFIFPEQVRSGDTIINEEYRRNNENGEVIGWYFDVTLRQPFSYTKYPLDKHLIWMQLWHKDFDRNVILTPDLTAYDSVEPGTIFGIDQDMVTGGWVVDETYFNYINGNYDTNFGIDDYIGEKNFPELYFNIIVGRKFTNAFIIILVPLLIVAVLLYSVLMTTTSDEEKADVFGFSTSGAIGVASALFFVVMLAHVQLREQFAGAGIVYIEQFYFAIYAAILLISLNVFIFSVGRHVRGFGWIHYKDNLIPKLVYWPLMLFILAIITTLYFGRG